MIHTKRKNSMKPSTNDLSSSSRFPSCLQSKSGWVHFFEMRRTLEPHLHQIEPTNHCLYSCIMCPRAKNMNRNTGFMEFALYKKVIDEVAAYSEPVRSQEIELFHFGESLLHPDIEKMVGYASRRKLRVTLSVNGPQLDPEIAEKLLHSGPYRLIVSLDGNDQESYEAIRGRNADFKRAIQNIDGLITIHKKMNSKTRISVRMIEMHVNEQLTNAFRKTWGKKEIEVEVREFFPWSEKEMITLGKFEKYPPFMPCPFPWKHLVVQWNGDVVPCCRDYNGAIKLGNVHNVSLKELWNSSAYEDFRQQMASGKFKHNTICPECLDIYSTEPDGYL